MKGLNLAEWAIRHKQIVYFFIIAIITGGLWSYFHLGRSEDPDFTIRQAVVTAAWPGASAQQITQQVTDPLEKKLQDTKGLDYIKSFTHDGKTVIYVNLKDSVPKEEMQTRWHEIRNLVNDEWGSLPSGVMGPYINDRFDDVYGSIYAVTGDGFSYEEKRKYAENIRRRLTGVEDVVQAELKKYQDYPKDRIQVVNATEVIETAEPPVFAIRKKKDSSIVVGLKMIKEKKADAFVSSGSTGAVLVGGQVLVGRSKGVERPPLAPLIPTAKGVSLLIDCGANVDARPSHLVQFAKMGSIYMENVVGIKNPRVAIVNNGAEEEKGNALVKETFPLLKEIEGINFIGSIEARDIPAGYADVIVCEAFVGNVILKLYEGVSSELIHKIKEGMMSTLKSKIGAALALPSLKKTLKAFDASQYGGAPLLGLNGLVVKTHGSSRAKEITNSIYQCVTFREENINEIIKERVADSKNNEEE